jgi:hypothetical protein
VCLFASSTMKEVFQATTTHEHIQLRQQATMHSILAVVFVCVGALLGAQAKSVCNCKDGYSTTVYDCATYRIEDDGVHPTCLEICNDPSDFHGGVSSCDDGTCFPGSAMVELENGHLIPMRELRVGQRVLVANRRYSEVFAFTHMDERLVRSFVKLNLASGTLRATASHLIYVNNSLLVPAGEIRVGDQLTTKWGDLAPVLSIEFDVAVGLYNPQTEQGDIVVVCIQSLVCFD